MLKILSILIVALFSSPIYSQTTPYVFEEPCVVLQPVVDDEFAEISKKLKLEVQRNLALNGIRCRSQYKLQQEILKSEAKLMNDPKFVQKIAVNFNLDNIFRVHLTRVDTRKAELNYEVLGKKGTNFVFRKKTLVNYTADEIYKIIKDWTVEYGRFANIRGIIKKREANKVFIKTNRLDFSEVENKEFVVDQQIVTNGKSFRPRGTFVGLRNGYLIGFIYTTDFIDQVKAGQTITVINSRYNIDGALQNFEVSQKWYNYLNSPRFSMRDCAILPIIGDFKRKKELEESLREEILEEGRCHLKHDQKFEDIFNRYGDGLGIHLQDDKVLKLIATKMGVGSLFRIKVKDYLMGTKIFLDVIGENGKDIYFSRELLIHKKDADYINDVVKNWFLAYYQTIPFDGKIVEIVDNRIVVDMGMLQKLDKQQQFNIYRPVSARFIRKSKELKSEWNKKYTGSGVIYEVKEHHSLGQVFKLKKGEEAKKGDWIIITDEQVVDASSTYQLNKNDVKTKRKIGRVTVQGTASKIGAVRTTDVGTFYSGEIGFDFFLPKGFLVYLEFARGFGNSRGASGASDSSLSNNNYEGLLGYTYKPRKWPVYTIIDFFAGYRVENFKVASFGVLGVGDLKYNGFLAGIRSEFRLYKKFHSYLMLESIPFMNTKNTVSVFGSIVGGSLYSGALGGVYKITEHISAVGEFNLRKYSTTYSIDNIQVKYNSNLVKFGVSLDF